ncbi:unnamed protein product, partial [Prorocentrum cordatum]
ATPRGAAAAPAQGPGGPAAPCPAAESDVYDMDWSSVCHQASIGRDSSPRPAVLDMMLRKTKQMEDQLMWLRGMIKPQDQEDLSRIDRLDEQLDGQVQAAEHPAAAAARPAAVDAGALGP